MHIFTRKKLAIDKKNGMIFYFVFLLS